MQGNHKTEKMTKKQDGEKRIYSRDNSRKENKPKRESTKRSQED